MGPPRDRGSNIARPAAEWFSALVLRAAFHSRGIETQHRAVGQFPIPYVALDRPQPADLASRDEDGFMIELGGLLQNGVLSLLDLATLAGWERA